MDHFESFLLSFVDITMEFLKKYIDLEPLCCKKRQKIVPDQLMVWGIRAFEGSIWY